jgi:hypothetical protein
MWPSCESSSIRATRVSTSHRKCNKARNEKRFVMLFGAALEIIGMPNHFVVDTSRNAKQGLCAEWDNTITVHGVGFGVRPTGITGGSLSCTSIRKNLGGDLDGVGKIPANRYYCYCGNNDVFKSSPEVGTGNRSSLTCCLITPAQLSGCLFGSTVGRRDGGMVGLLKVRRLRLILCATPFPGLLVGRALF